MATQIDTPSHQRASTKPSNRIMLLEKQSTLEFKAIKHKDHMNYKIPNSKMKFQEIHPKQPQIPQPTHHGSTKVTNSTQSSSSNSPFSHRKVTIHKMMHSPKHIHGDQRSCSRSGETVAHHRRLTIPSTESLTTKTPSHSALANSKACLRIWAPLKHRKKKRIKKNNRKLLEGIPHQNTFPEYRRDGVCKQITIRNAEPRGLYKTRQSETPQLHSR